MTKEVGKQRETEGKGREGKRGFSTSQKKKGGGGMLCFPYRSVDWSIGDCRILTQGMVAGRRNAQQATLRELDLSENSLGCR